MRLIANVLASVAAYENEVRGERIVAGQSAARASGKRWGGSSKGRRVKVTPEQLATILRLDCEGVKKAGIARATGLSQPTVYAALHRGMQTYRSPQRHTWSAAFANVVQAAILRLLRRTLRHVDSRR